MVKSSKLILPIVLVIGAFIAGVSLVKINTGYAQNPQPSDCQYCQEYNCCPGGGQSDTDPNCNLPCGTDPSCGEWCDGGQNERPSLECTGLNVQGQPSPGATVKLTCSGKFKYAGDVCNPRTNPPYVLFYMSTDNEASWTPIIEAYDRNIYARRLKAGITYDFTVPATATGNISFKCETYVHDRTDYDNDGDKDCWMEQPNNQDFYVHAWKKSAPVCKQSFTPERFSFKCDNLTRDIYEPQPGSTVRYTCTANGTGYSAADFRVTVDGVVPAGPNATVSIPDGESLASYDFTVPADATTVTADCRICKDAATRVCTEWGVSNIEAQYFAY